MRRFGMLWWMWVLALTPLLIGSVAFFWWFYARSWFAHDARIEGLALFAILTYLVFTFVVVVLSIGHWVRGAPSWYGPLGPLMVLVFTFGMINVYSTAYDRLNQSVFLRVDARGSGCTDLAIWSAHFEQGWRKNPDEKELVFEYTPSYTYDWNVLSSSRSNWTVDDVFIDIHRGGRVETRMLPHLEKGACGTMDLQELLELPLVPSRPDPQAMGD